MHKYYWQVSCSAPAEFPVELIAGGFYTPEGQFIGIPSSSFISQSWGSSGAHDATDIRPIMFPDTLRIIWLSMRDRKFFGGALSLKHLPFQKIFDEPYTDAATGEKLHYDEIRLGLAPGGYIVLWAVGTSRIREIGMIRADTFAYDLRKLAGDSCSLECYVGLVSEGGRYDLSFVEEHEPAATKWSVAFRQNHLMQMKITTTAKLGDILQERFDGTFETFRDSAVWEAAMPQTIPKATLLSWTNIDGAMLHGSASYDETEIFAAVEKLESLRPQAPLTLQLEINQYDNSIHAFLTDGTHLITLQRTKTEVWR